MIKGRLERGEMVTVPTGPTMDPPAVEPAVRPGARLSGHFSGGVRRGRRRPNIQPVQRDHVVPCVKLEGSAWATTFQVH